MADAARTCVRCVEVKLVNDSNFRVVNEVRAGKPYVYSKRVCRPCEYEERVAYGRRNRDKQNAQRRAMATPSKYREGNLKKFYGLSIEQYEQMLLAQNGGCAICGSPPHSEYHKSQRTIPLQVDHNHSTGAVRGLLCGGCNRGIGSLRESADLLARAIKYLKVHQNG